MKKTFVFAALGLWCAAMLTAADSDPRSEVKAATKKLGDKANYSWTATPKMEGGPGGGNFRPGPTEGQTEKGGITYLRMTMGDRTIESAVQGEKVAIKGEDGWESAENLEGNRQFMARRMKNYKAPATEAADLADKARSLKLTEGAISGDLTEEGAREMLSLGGRRPNANANAGPKDAKGSVKFWLKDGELVKYEFTVQGTITGRDDQEFKINRTTTVQIKDAGTTKLSVPEEARKKLS